MNGIEVEIQALLGMNRDIELIWKPIADAADLPETKIDTSPDRVRYQQDTHQIRVVIRG